MVIASIRQSHVAGAVFFKFPRHWKLYRQEQQQHLLLLTENCGGSHRRRRRGQRHRQPPTLVCHYEKTKAIMEQLLADEKNMCLL